MAKREKQNKIFIVTSCFPPVSAVGIHRTVALCKYLVERDWDVTVITTRPGAGTSLDERLLDRVPEQVRVVWTASLDMLGVLLRILKPRAIGSNFFRGKGGDGRVITAGVSRASSFRRMVDWMSWWLHVPDRLIGWLFPAVWTGLREARHRRPDVIFSTAPKWTCHLVGLVLSRLLHVPWVADFRDPWCGSSWRKIPYKAHRWFDSKLEQLILNNANHISCATEAINQQLSNRYPHKARMITTIHNGFDPEQIDSVKPVSLDNSRCVLLHIGTLYGPRSPVPLLQGLQACLLYTSPSPRD